MSQTGRTAIGATDIQAAIDEACTEAEFMPGASRSHVTPLATIVRAQGLPVDELTSLCVRSAVKHFIRRSGHDLLHGDDAEPLAGYIYANRAGGWILVNADDPVARRRFTVAHELGHYLLHFLPALRIHASGGDADEAVRPEFGELIPRVSGPTPDDSEETASRGRIVLAEGVTVAVDPDVIEREADAFAASLLMPEPICRELFRQFAQTFGRSRIVLARRMATEFLVSRTAMEQRLIDLDIA